MTTKKQRRAMVAAKRARFDAAYRADGLAALNRSRDKDAQKQFDSEREASKKRAKQILDDQRSEHKGV